MLTYVPLSEQALPKSTEKPWLLLLLCLVWLLPGLFGRDPLKPDETLVVDMVKQMLDGSGLSVPMVAGEPMVERAPLFLWVASGFAWFGRLAGIAIHDSARIASVMFSALTLWGVGLAGRETLGRRHGRSAVLILIGCLGFLMPGHMLNPDIATLAGWSFGLYALILSRRLPIQAGFLLGASAVVMGLSSSLIEPLMLFILAMLVGLLPGWRNTRYGTGFLLALASSLPLLVAWPLELARLHPGQFTTWCNDFALGWFGGFRDAKFFHSFGFYMEMLPWFAWPAWPLAAATLWMHRDRMSDPRLQLPVLASALILASLVFSGQERASYALLLLPPLAVCGAFGLDILRRGASAFLNWFGIMTFGILGVWFWVAWCAMNFGIPVKMAQRIAEIHPGFVSKPSPEKALVAIVLTAIWIWAVSRRRPMGRHAVTNWAAGITLFWGLFVCFGTDWVNHYNGYADLSRQLAKIAPRHACMERSELGPSQRAVFHYYANIVTQDTVGRCPFLLQQENEASAQVPGNYVLIWDGNRAGDRTEHYRLYRHLKTP